MISRVYQLLFISEKNKKTCAKEKINLLSHPILEK